MISAYGLLASDFVQFESMTRRALVDDRAPAIVRSVHDEMRERALRRAKGMGLPGEFRVSFVADMRFVGQAFEVPVELGEDDLACLTAERLHRLFGEAHQRVYFFGAALDKQVEIVSFRMGLTAPLDVLPVLTKSAEFAVPEQDIEMFNSRSLQRGRLMSRSALGPAANSWPRAPRRPDLDASRAGALDSRARPKRQHDPALDGRRCLSDWFHRNGRNSSILSTTPSSARA